MRIDVHYGVDFMEDAGHGRRRLHGAAEELGLAGKVDVRLKLRNSPYMQSFALDEQHPLVWTLQEEFHAVTGGELSCAYGAPVCDSNILAVTLGIPVVTFGPSGGNMHGDNEYGYAWQVKNCGEIYRRTVARLLGGKAKKENGRRPMDGGHFICLKALTF